MKRPAVLLFVIVVVASAGAVLLFRLVTAVSDRDATAAFAVAAARAQQMLESCLYDDREPGSWADDDLARRFAGFGELWRQGCLYDPDRELRKALRDGPSTPAIESYRKAIRQAADVGPCETTLARRRALADLQAAAELDVIEVPAIECELSGPTLERVAAPAGETMAFVVGREPELVAYFERDDPTWSHAALRDGAWVELPRYPERQILFDPTSLVSVAAGNPQPVLRYDGGTWREIARGPKGFDIRALRSTVDGGLVAVAVAFEEPRIAILRAASLDAPLKVVATRSLETAEGRPELAIHLGDDGTVLIVNDAALEEGRTLEVTRQARGDSEIAVSQVGSFEVEGRASLYACGPDKRWIHRRGGHQDDSSILFSSDGGRSFEEAGTVPPGGALACVDNGSLLWVGKAGQSPGVKAVRCDGEPPPNDCHPFEPFVLGGERAFITVDGAKVVGFDSSSGEGLVWTAADFLDRDDVGVRGPSDDGGLDNLWRMDDQLLIELPIP